ncbi:MAG: YheV family putative metal-binding protein [Moraxella sp.]|uniref:YheV family putative metal-binding protein n=1 Tax=Moraxella sp. TaxID=479 RepID=UPI0026DC4922|nr:YheV family putative metal-binding protein [Moraxella sp.]MDO4450515.1 YheV family putative metal-binding protein [Moraxella sp.]
MRYQSTRPKRQFLAGVKCTQCGQIDTTVQVQIFIPEPDEYIECVQCNHTERRPTAEDLPNIQTERGNDDVGVVRFITSSQNE